jgi:thymidylate kinase/HD superfamily phosphodiesterase
MSILTDTSPQSIKDFIETVKSKLTKEITEVEPAFKKEKLDQIVKLDLHQFCDLLTADYPDTSHDLKHHQDVTKLALEIFDNEEPDLRLHSDHTLSSSLKNDQDFKLADREQLIRCRKLIEVSAMLHDVIDHKFPKDLELRKQILDHYLITNYAEQTNAIKWIIANVSYSSEVKNGRPKHDDPIINIALSCVSASDKFWALGLVGIQRCLEFTISRLSQAYPQAELTYDKVVSHATQHFHEKLLRLKDHFIHVDYVKKICEEPHKVLEEFIRQNPIKARYLCFEGTEGVGKTTQSKKLYEHLVSQGYNVLYTKEPGSPHQPVSLKLRELMLDASYQNNLDLVKDKLRQILKDHAKDLTDVAVELLNKILETDSKVMIPINREYLSQAIRSVHFEKLIYPAMYVYNYIIQDRGVLSGLAYGYTCGNDIKELNELACSITKKSSIEEVYQIYDKIIVLTGDVNNHLEKAKACKQEFKAGDVIEEKGINFISNTNDKLIELAKNFNSEIIEVDGKNIDEVASLIIFTSLFSETIEVDDESIDKVLSNITFYMSQ